MNEDYSKGNLAALLELGYVAIGPVANLPQIDESVIQRTEQELVEKKAYLEFREGDITGCAWYNNFLEKWFCDVYRNSVYRETILAFEMRHLVKNVQAIYSNSGRNRR